MPDSFLLDIHVKPISMSDRIALKTVKFMRVFADAFFKKRYGHRAVILETVAAIPGMVGAMLKHLKCLRRIEDDQGWIKELLDEAENERMHLMTFIEIAQPNFFERGLIITAQFLIFTFYLLLYIFSPRTAHRIVGYLEEEAIISYTQYLQEINNGGIENAPAPQIAKTYWNLKSDARLSDLIIVVREDECKHRDANHRFAQLLTE